MNDLIELAGPVDAIRRYLDGLPTGDRLVCLLHFADGLSVEELALLLDKPQKVIASQLEHHQQDLTALTRSSMIRR